MDCPSCQNTIPDSARFCPHCGQRFGAADAPLHVDNAKQPNTATEISGGKIEPKKENAAAIELTADDFARAFQRALDDAKVAHVDVEPPHDPESLHAAGVAAGLDRKDVQRALQRISMEKLPAAMREKMGIILDDEVPPASKRWWIPIVAVVNITAVVLIVWALFFRSSGPPIEIKPQKGTIDVAALEEPVSQLSTAAQDCYQSALKTTPKLAGEIVVTLRVQLNGQVLASTAKESLGDAKVVACILNAAQIPTWPKAEIAPVDVDIPLSFKVATDD